MLATASRCAPSPATLSGWYRLIRLRYAAWMVSGLAVGITSKVSYSDLAICDCSCRLRDRARTLFGFLACLKGCQYVVTRRQGRRTGVVGARASFSFF